MVIMKRIVFCFTMTHSKFGSEYTDKMHTVGLKSQRCNKKSTSSNMVHLIAILYVCRYPFCNKESSFKWDLLAKQIEKTGLHDSDSSQNVFDKGR